MNKTLSDWYIVAERFNFNTEALCHAIKDTGTLKSYVSLAHIRVGLKDGQIQPYQEALTILMNMNINKAKKYVKKYPDRIDLEYLELKAEKLLAKLQENKNLNSDDILSMAHAVDPIGKILDILLAKLVSEKKYKEVI